jgi:ribosomal protein S18 acetylase RimI-like enzyme
VKLRSYQPHDFGAVDRLWRQVFPNDPERNRAANAVPAKLAMEDELLMVAEGGEGQVVGTIMAGYDGHRGWLYSVAVDPRHQRRGIGRALVAEALTRLAALGCVKVNLQIREGNAAVTQFYERMGFEVEPRIQMGIELTRPQAGAIPR